MKEILIFENHPQELKRILSVIPQGNNRVKVSVAETENEFYAKLMQEEIDLFIIGVAVDSKKYGDLAILDVMENIRWIEKYQYTPIILLTNLEDPGRRIINEFHCFGLLEKPVKIEVLKKVVGDAINAPARKNKRKNIYLKQDGVINAIRVDEIIYIENRQRLLQVHTAQGEHLIKYETAKHFMKKINDARFLQCSRQVIVNVDFIRKVDFVNRYISLKGTQEVVEIGSAMKRKFRDALECSQNALWL